MSILVYSRYEDTFYDELSKSSGQGKEALIRRRIKYLQTLLDSETPSPASGGAPHLPAGVSVARPVETLALTVANSNLPDPSSITSVKLEADASTACATKSKRRQRQRASYDGSEPYYQMKPDNQPCTMSAIHESEGCDELMDCDK